MILLLFPALTGGLTKAGAFVSAASPQDKEDIFTLSHGLLLKRVVKQINYRIMF